MKKILLLLICAAIAVAAQAETSAAGLLDKCAAKLLDAPSVSATFTIAVDGGDVSGNILIARERFRITSPRLNMWFDGRTQWTALSRTREVSISEPTAEELLSSNPFAIITGYSTRYNCRMLKSADGAHAVRQVELTPKTSTGDIRRAVISIDTRTLWPVKAVVTMASGATVRATVSDCRIGKKPAASAFTFQPSLLPGYEIIDLR